MFQYFMYKLHNQNLKLVMGEVCMLNQLHSTVLDIPQSNVTTIVRNLQNLCKTIDTLTDT